MNSPRRLRDEAHEVETLISGIGSAFGTVLGFCVSLAGNEGAGILIFTLFTRIVLMPVSIWTHLNGLKVVRMQPEVNRLKIRYFGDRDTIAEKQAELYKREGYHPLAGLIPLIAQLVLLLGVIGAVRGRQELAGSLFLGADLGATAAGSGPAYIPVPLLAGLSSLLLSLSQNRHNPLQREQGRGMQWGTLAFSVGLSLYLGFFVPVGVVLYWIAGNLMAIAQQALLNRLFDPGKAVDYTALANTKKELEELEGLGKDGSRNDRELKRREKADYKRFFSLANKHLVFYSESGGFYKYFGPVMNGILARSNVTIHYVTSDPEDPVFSLAEENDRLKAYYIGPKKLITLFLRMDADVVVMTMTDLDNYHYKRSYVRKDIRYIYLFHYPLSTHMVLHTGALDHYDEILCVGEFQIPEIRKREEQAGLPAKKLEVCGYCQLDSLYRAYQAMDRRENARPLIVVAPSWQEGNILDSCIDPLLESLLGRGWTVRVRPHPEYMKRYRPRMDSIMARWQDRAEGLEFETDFTSNESIYAADLVITDWSGTATEFSFITLRPSLFIDTPPKINNPDYDSLGIEPQEFRLRHLIGETLAPENAGTAGDLAARLLEEKDRRAERIRLVRDELIAHFPDSAPVSARAILRAVMEQQKKMEGREKHEGSKTA